MGSPALGGEAARAPIVIFDINEVVVVTMRRMSMIVLRMVVTMMRMIILITEDGRGHEEDDRDCDEDGRSDHPCGW